MRVALVIAMALVAGCQHLPGGSKIGIEFELGGKSPSVQQAKAWRKQNEKVLINGTPVDRAKYPHVIRIFNGSSSCTASVVGPRVILTAAHCAETGDVVKFSTINGKTFQAKMTQAPGYPDKDLDLALGIVSQDIGVKPGVVKMERFERKGMDVQLIGYGCVKPGGGGGNDGVLRTGMSKIAGGQGYDLVLETPDGAALCYGDSGGPVFYEGAQIAVNSKGNIEDRSYVTRTTLPESNAFLKQYASDNGVQVCGVNSECGGSQPPPPPGPKTFRFEDDNVVIEGRVK